MKYKKLKHNNEIKIISAIIVVSLIIGFLFLINNGLISKSKSEDKTTKGENFSFFNEEKCRCFERQRLKCPDNSWELDTENRLCRKGNDVTSVLLGCSAYECSGTIHRFNFEINEWEESE